MGAIKWLDAAKQSDKEEVKTLLAEYEKEKTRSKKEKLRDEIIVLLTPKADETEAVKSDDKEVSKPEKTEKDNLLTQKQKNEKAEKIKEYRDKVYALEHSRLKNATYEENKELNAKIKVVNKKIVALRDELRQDRAKAKIEKMKQNGKVTSVKLKQAKVLKLLKEGFSFTNITKHSEGVKKSEIVKVIDNDPEFMAEMKKISSRLPIMWLNWKKKFDNVDTEA